MNYVLNLPKYAGQKVLLQAYMPEIYYNFGFNKDYYHKITNVDKKSYQNDYDLTVIEDLDFVNSLKLYNDFTKDFNGYRKRDIDYYQNYLIARCRAYNDRIKLFYDNAKIIGYAIYHESASKIEVSEIIYTNYESLNKIVCFLSKTNKELIIESDLNNEIIGDCTYICTMLTNFLKNSCQDNKFYINAVSYTHLNLTSILVFA